MIGAKSPENDLEGFISEHISNKKIEALKMVLGKYDMSQSVHLHNYWKCRLRDELGLDAIVDFGFGIIGKDPYRGQRGLVVKAFYGVLVPEKVIASLTVAINQIKHMNCAALRMIHELKGSGGRSEDWNAMFTAPDNDILAAVWIPVTDAFTKYMLLRMGLITEKRRV